MSTNAPEQTMLYPLAQWSADLEYDALPEEVVRQARLSLLDTLGCTIAGVDHQDNQTILRGERIISGPSDRGATVAITGDKLSVPAAAKVNSCFASIRELDDNTAGHGSLVTVPVGLAVAEAHRINGRDLLTSMVAAYEVTGRILDASFDGLKSTGECGLIQIAAPNTAGAAAQTAKLLGADAQGVFDAINVGLALTPFSPIVNAKVGSGVKPLVFSGFHVYAGTIGALYAMEGLTAADDNFESDYGGILHTVAHTWDEGVLTKGLGEEWYLDAPNRKRHACCGYTHSSIDGTWAMLRENGIAVGDVTRIDVDLPTAAFELVGSPLLGDLTPRGAQFHLPYVLAAALVTGEPISPAHTEPETLTRMMGDPDFRALMDQITVSHDEDLLGRFSSRVRVTTRDGATRTEIYEDAVGRGSQQFSERDIEDKFRGLAATELTSGAIDEIVHMVREVEHLDDVSQLVRALVR